MSKNPLSPEYILLDGDNMCHRRFHALHRFSSYDGLPTGMVFGMLNSIYSFQRTFPNAKFITCFDKLSRSDRERKRVHNLNYGKRPSSFSLQMRIIKEILPNMGIAIVEKQGYEADQILATLAKKMPGDKLIVSEDKDLAQCVNPHVRLFQKPGKKWVQIDEDAVLERYGVPPNKIPDFLALAGDDADGIPGVFGIGPGGAKDLLRSHISALDAATDPDVLANPRYEGVFSPQVVNNLRDTLAITTLDGNIDIPVPTFPKARADVVNHILKMLGLKVAAERLKTIFPDFVLTPLSEREQFLLEKKMHEEVFRDRYIPSPPKPSVWDTVPRL